MIIIPAKHSSSRLKSKNFIPFYKHLSLFQIAVIRALHATTEDIHISSENKPEVNRQLDYLSRYTNLGKVHVRERPALLAKDPSTIIDVLIDVLISPIKYNDDVVTCILPTSPFSSIESIQNIQNLAFNSNLDRIISVSPSSKPPFNAWSSAENIDANCIIRLSHTFADSPYKNIKSTECPQTYFSNGCVSTFLIHSLLNKSPADFSIGGFLMNNIASIDIDHEYEFKLAQSGFQTLSDDLYIIDKFLD